MSDPNGSVRSEDLGPAAAVAVDRAAAGEIVPVTRAGRPVAVVVGFEALRGMQRERELLRRLALGELEAAAGQGDELDAVIDDCLLLLEES